MEYPAFNVFLGGRVAHRGDGEATIELDLKPHHLNQRRVVHGGVISALLDSALGLAVISSIPKEWWCATIALNIQFMSGKGEGTLTAKGRVTRRGKRVAFAEGEILDERGRTVARATGNWHLWNYKPGERRLGGGPWVQLRDSQETLPVGKILAVGRNYAAHNVEMGNAPTAAPIFFLKPSSAILHDGGRVELPSDVGSVHHEVELVAVIGKPGRAIEEADALDHVLGYAVGLDLTLRDLQSEAKKNGEPWSLSKGFDGSAPISTVVPAESVGDGSGLAISLSVNGEQRQSGNTDQMSRSVAQLIAHASRFMTLERGDLLYTGTPEGVGPINAGDKLVAAIDGIGELHIDVGGVE